MPEPLTVHIEDEDDSVRVDPVNGTIETDQPDGSVVVHLDAKQDEDDGEDKFYANLAIKMDGTKLSMFANELIDAIQADDNSRANYLAVRARGLGLLGLKLEEPKSTVGDASSGSEGMSSVTNPLLLEAILKGWANAYAELLPAEGPAKISDEGDESEAEDELADALETGFNHYLTKTAPEYYAETSHMLLWGTYFGGSGFKKVYRCPMRRRPVSEGVDAKDLIVSDTTKDLRACGRITHQITMRPSVMKRMMLLGAYRKVPLTQPSPTPNTVDQKIAAIQGTQARVDRPEDQPYALFESQCELDIPEFATGKFKDEGIPLPYLVTIDKDSREILGLFRDWRKEDEDCQRKRMYVKYPYVPGPGFYGTGMLNILGNSSAAMTAAWREALDAGMFASFPGGLIQKLAGRQNTSNFRVAPGEFAPVETGGQAIQDVVMGMPYKDVTPGLLSMMDQITNQSKSLASSIEVPAGEGVQNVPVGSILAQIEQATKIMATAHKGMHQAQAEEFDLMLDLFREEPEDFWRGNKEQNGFWDADKFRAALSDTKLVPRADPNTPSHIHRIMKAWGLVTLIANPALAGFLSAKEVLMRCLRALREDPKGLVVDPPPNQPQADPIKMLEAQAKMKTADNKQLEVGMKAQSAGADTTLKAAQIQSDEKIAGLNLQKEQVIHRADMVKEAQNAAHERDMAHREHGLDQSQHALETVKTAHDMQMAEREHDLASATAASDAKIAEKVANKPKPTGKKK